MVVIELSGVQFIMVIELIGVQFVLKSYNFKIERARSASSI